VRDAVPWMLNDCDENGRAARAVGERVRKGRAERGPTPAAAGVRGVRPPYRFEKQHANQRAPAPLLPGLLFFFGVSVMSDAQEMVPGRRRADSLFQAVGPVGLTSFRDVARRRSGMVGVT